MPVLTHWFFQGIYVVLNILGIIGAIILAATVPQEMLKSYINKGYSAEESEDGKLLNEASL